MHDNEYIPRALREPHRRYPTQLPGQLTHSVGGDDVELLLLAIGDHLGLGDLDGLLLLLLGLGLGLLLLVLPPLPVRSRLPAALYCCCRRRCCCFSLGIGSIHRGIGTGGVYIAWKRAEVDEKGFLSFPRYSFAYEKLLRGREQTPPKGTRVQAEHPTSAQLFIYNWRFSFFNGKSVKIPSSVDEDFIENYLRKLRVELRSMNRLYT